MGNGNLTKISLGTMTETAKGDYTVYGKNITTSAVGKINEISGKGIFYGEPEKRNGYKDDSVDLVIGVFFDGTQNNRVNNTLRTDHEKDSKKSTRGLERVDSYQNAPSNIQNLTKVFIEDRVHGYIYIEGVATTNYQKDKILAAGFGVFDTGIKDKVKKGCEELAELIFKLIRVQELKINNVTIDIFGFSRGATCARNFIHEITKPERETALYRSHKYGNGAYKAADGTEIPKDIKTITTGTLSVMLPARGMFGQYLSEKQLKFNSLNLRFAGLFDSVSSFGLMHRNDVRELNLNAINKMSQIVHLTAGDERRDNFELTAVTKGITKELPGVHSDIGGGYRDQIKDEYLVKVQQTEHVLLSFDPKIESERKRLIAQGWYTKEQLSLKGNGEENQLLFGTRQIRNSYANVPLHLMVQFGIKLSGVKFDIEALNLKFKIAEDDPELNLKKVYQRLYDYSFNNAPPMLYFTNPEIEILRKKAIEGLLSKEKFALLANDHNMLRQLRNRYLHNSADFGSLGMQPTWDNRRVIYNQKKR